MTPRRTTTTLASTLAASALVATSLVALEGMTQPASATSLTIPRHATIVIRGHGFGHGHGMSQYGAEGAARAGLSAQQIMRFYYPHTRAGTFSGKVRVLISEDTDQILTVIAQPGLQVRDLTSGTTVTVPATGKAAKATRWRISSRRGQPAQVSYLTDSWHLWHTLTGDAEFRPGGSPLRLVLPGHVVTYRGVLDSLTSTRGGSRPHRITVNQVSMEDYVRGVVPSEAIVSWHQAALRAQAIAARSYAAYGVAPPISTQYSLCDTTSCQVYGGLSAEQPSTNEATAKTVGEIRTYGGAAAFTQFSSSNGGWLAAGSQPYLVAKQDPYDGWAGNPNHSWHTTVSDARIEKAWPTLGNLRRITVLTRDGNGQWGGRIETMRLVGSAGTVNLDGDTFRGKLGLRSTWLSFSVS